MYFMIMMQGLIGKPRWMEVRPWRFKWL